MHGMARIRYRLCSATTALGVRVTPTQQACRLGGELERSTLERIVRRLTRTRGFVWTVRFDHGPLAFVLESLNVPFQRTATHVLGLEHGYARSPAIAQPSVTRSAKRSVAGCAFEPPRVKEISARITSRMRASLSKRNGGGTPDELDLRVDQSALG